MKRYDVAGYVPVLAAAMSAVFVLLCWTAGDRLHRQVVLSPKDAAAGNGTDTHLTRETAQSAERMHQGGMWQSRRIEATQLSHELWRLRTRHGEAVRLELGPDGVEGIEKVLHALANGNFSDACAGAGQLIRGTRFALDSHSPEPTGQQEARHADS